MRKPMDWFLYDNGLRHESIKMKKVKGHANFGQVTLTAKLIGVMMEITKEINKGSVIIINDLTRLSPIKKYTAFSTFYTSKTVSYSIFFNLFFSKKSSSFSTFDTS